MPTLLERFRLPATTPAALKAGLRDHRAILTRWAIFLAVVVVAALGLWRYATQPTLLRVAVGPAGSERAAFVHDIARRLVDGSQPVRLRVIETATAADAARLLEDSKVDLAVARSDESGLDDARSVVVMDKRVIVLVTRASSVPEASATTTTLETSAPTAATSAPGAARPAAALTTPRAARRRPPTTAPSAAAEPQDFPPLQGRSLVVGRDLLGSNRDLIARLLPWAGVVVTDQVLREMPVDKIGAALAARTADVAILVIDPSSLGARSLIAAIARDVGEPLKVSGFPLAEAVGLIHRDLGSQDIPAGLLSATGPLPAQKIPTVNLTEELIADSDLSDYTVTALTKALLEIRGRSVKLDASPYEIEPPPLEQRRRFMPHSGAAAYLNDRAQSFMERYSDQIWLALFGLGLAGSSIVGLLGWFGLNRPVRVDPIAREAEGLVASLDRLQTMPELTAARFRLRQLAAEQITSPPPKRDRDASRFTDPVEWYPLADALVMRRLGELTETAADAKQLAQPLHRAAV